MTVQKRSSWLFFILLALVWGSSFILMKEGAKNLSGWQIAATRIFAASVVFLPFGIYHVRKLPGQKVPIVILTGLLGNLFPAFFFGVAINKIESSTAGILNSLTPLFVIVIGVLFFQLKIHPRKLAGVLLGFAGLFILSLSKGPVSVNNIGFTLLILLATICYGLNVNIVSTYLKGIDPIKMSTVSISFLFIPASILLYFFPYDVSADAVRKSVLAIVVLGLLGSALATVLFYLLIKKAGGLFASLVTYVVPLVAMFWGFLDNENIGLIQVSCLAIILSGVYLANK